jgi:polyisoprenoid-binding protein YceI
LPPSTLSPWSSFVRNIVLLAGILLALPAHARAATLVLKSGEVRYAVEIKTLGIGGGTIVGVNKQLIARVETLDGRVQGGLIVPVVKFETDNTRRDKDVAKILDYENHPAITFEVVEISATDIDRVLTEDEGEVPLRGKITVAGGAKVYDMWMQFKRVEDGVRCSTTVDAKFSDFGLKPPSFGLILKTAPDEITLSGDVVFGVAGD